MQNPDEYLRRLDQVNKMQHMNFKDLSIADLADDNRLDLALQQQI